ncbi:metal-dependent hydrolase [Brevibacillus centrosporus]|uniref:metal-dependent hydrolase n=1 Tax=Brevibacillus centrosporus TaxID=54910 RepID=UPI001144BA2A|nr:metal-dependent hydrolase [Brevibacillus centrosporus]MEC2133266.1 metal-dependent hydrolase [Brevibacillus centrosporus]GED34780.1 hypothetical protein BCE02nite_59210 [Brevibacillus centrosporus]
MTWKTHLVLGAMAGYYANASWTGMVAGAAFALAPDIDKARSKAGKMIWPLSWLVEKGIGHRTLTHSWIMLFLPALLLGNPSIAHAALLWLLSQLISDALVGQIQLFWPIRQGWIGIPLPKFLYRMVDVLVFYAAIGYSVYLAYEKGIDLLG